MCQVIGIQAHVDLRRLYALMSKHSRYIQHIDSCFMRIIRKEMSQLMRIGVDSYLTACFP